MKPDFIGIGCQHTATTWTSACIAQHPSVYIAPQKEVSFFDVRYDRGLGWYKQQFEAAPPYAVVGEWSPGYIVGSQPFARATAALEGVKILSTFRNPVDRLVSHYQRYRAQGATHKGLFDEIGSESIYTRMSLYAADWKRWTEHFSPQNCLALIFEDLIRDPHHSFREIFKFLGVDPDFEPDLEAAREKRNARSGNQRQWIMDCVARMRNVVSRTPANGLIGFGKNLGFRTLLLKAAKGKGGGQFQEQLSAEDRRILFNRYFAADVAELQKMLPARDLSQWLPRDS